MAYPTVTSSIRKDVFIFIIIAAMMIVSSFRLTVYYRIFAAEVSLFYVNADGIESPLTTPEKFRKIGSPAYRKGKALRRLEHHIRNYMGGLPVTFHLDPGSRIEWRVRHSFNSSKLDQTHTIVFEGEDFESSHRVS